MHKKLFLVLALSFSLANIVGAAEPLEVDKLLQEGKNACKLGRYNLAGKLFNKAILAAPERYDTYLNSARAWMEMGDCPQAINDLEESIRLNPSDMESRCIKSYAAYMSGDYDGALSDIKTAMGIQPKNAFLYYARGFIYESKGDIEKALDDYDAALRLLKKTAKKKRADGLILFAEVTDTCTFDKEGAAIYFQRGMAYSQDGNFKAARKYFQKAVNIKPELAKKLPEGVINAAPNE